MKVLSKVNGWRSLVGVLGVAALALGLSLKLEGAPPGSQLEQPREKVLSQVTKETTTKVQTSSTSQTPVAVTNGSTPRMKTGTIPATGLPVIATIQVDWRDDEGTRLRQAGKLIGPMPFPGQAGGVASAGGCTFNIDCDDVNKCTIDTCNIPPTGPIGAGKCEHTPVADGAVGGCDDGDYCNGAESCKNLVCSADTTSPPGPGATCTANADCPGGSCYGECSPGVASSCCADRDGCNVDFATCDENSDNKGAPCVSNANCRGGRCNRCVALCATAADCDDKLNCNGIEACTSMTCHGGTPPIPNVCTTDANCPGGGKCLGTCVRGVNLCGAGAKCSEGYCFGGANDQSTGSLPCNTNAGCPDGECVPGKCTGFGAVNSCKVNTDCPSPNTCVPSSPVCYAGRCCTAVDEAGCTKKKLSACTTGTWYAGDDGEMKPQVEFLCGGSDPDDTTADAWGCPRYSAGFTQTTAGTPPVYPVMVGPISESPACVPPPGGRGGTGGACADPLDPAGRFYQLGDDYHFTSGGYLGLDVVRFVLDITAVSRLSMDVYDASGKFVEDMNVKFQENLDVQQGIVVLILRDPMTIPPDGWIVLRTAERFLPNSRFLWFSTTETSIGAGSNYPDALWINGYPGPASTVHNNFLKMCVGGPRANESCVTDADCPDAPACPGGDCTCGAAPGILAFELAGDQVTPAPSGACCNSAAGTCQDGVVSWECTAERFCSNSPSTSCTTDAQCQTPAGGFCLSNVYHGDGSLCKRCNGGTRNAQSCSVDPVCPPTRMCVGGSNPGTLCPLGTECNGGTCTDQGTCSTGKVGTSCSPVGNDAMCNEQGVCNLETLLCANTNALNKLCAVGSDCDVAGTCIAVGCISIAACGNGACCDTGACSLKSGPGTDVGQCPVANWQGFGTDCDADNGLDNAQQHCCPIPNYSDLRCMSGPKNLSSCALDSDCRFCMGGTHNGEACTTTSAAEPDGCLDVGTCNLGTGLCVGGARNGLACAVESECPDNSGVCRGRCVSRGTGGDNCMDAYIHVITVPSLNEAPKTVTISGSNLAATSTAEEPENCKFGAAGSDPMWWEAFSIDKCARVRLDFCCTDPVLEPSWASIVGTCNPDGSCANIIGDELDPFTPSLHSASSRGTPYCVGDDNIWETYGPLQAGTYWKAVNSDLAGTHGSYQMHFTVQACPTAACCKPDNTCAVSTQGECDAANGFFLAPPQVGRAVAFCLESTCTTGSCCSAPGVCEDQSLGVTMTDALCTQLYPTTGNFIGGIRCKGGTCVGGGNATYSCNVPADCPNGACTGSTAQLAQKLPCPLCPYVTDANCQHDFPGGGTVYLADISSTTKPTRVADDVKIPVGGGGLLKDLCVMGLYVSGTGGSHDCGQTAVDDFTVRVYQTTSDVDYTPGVLVGTSATTPLRAVEYEARYGTPTVNWLEQIYRHNLELVRPITLLENKIYWIQVYNNTVGTDASCNWYWMEANTGQGNGIFFQDLCQVYTVDDAVVGDISLCMNLAFDTPPTPERACCTGDGCTKLSFADCQAVNGSWQFGQLDCGGGFVCPVASNDFCVRAPYVHEGAFEFNLFGSSMDGPATEQCPTTTTNFGADIWYFYQPTESRTAYIGTCSCETNARADEVVAIYTNSNDPTQCLCPGQPGFTLLKQNNVNRCHDGSQPNFINLLGCSTYADNADEVVEAVAGNCYTVRVASWGGNPPTTLAPPLLSGTLRIALDPAICGNNIVETRGGEQCDGTSDALCPGNCNQNCLCPPPVCGDFRLDSALGEECDGTAAGGSAPCSPLACRGPGDPDGECTCIPYCGNNHRQGSEICDGTDNALCGGALCRTDGSCRCVAVCGNGSIEPGEQCDPGGLGSPPAAASDALCKTRCIATGLDACTCPPAFCGNNYTEASNNEECDGLDLAGEGKCPPEECRPPGDPAGECTCACAVAVAPANQIVWDPATNPTPWPNANAEATTRSLRFMVTGPETPSKVDAIKVTMVDLQHPNPRNAPSNPPANYTTFDTRSNGVCTGGQYAGHHCDVTADCTGTTNGTCTNLFACTAAGEANGCARWVGKPSTFYESQGPPLAGPYLAARLQCTPYYDDWKSKGLITVVGAEIVPSSEYSVLAYAASCIGTESTCTNVSAAVTMYTRRSGDLDTPYNPGSLPITNQPNAADISQIVNKFKNLVGSPVHARAQLQPNLPELNASINSLDIVAVVDAFKGLAYAFNGPCPCPSTQVCGLTCTGCAGMCVKTCTGGTNAGEPCIGPLHCPGGACSATGTCRDKCGRCN